MPYDSITRRNALKTISIGSSVGLAGCSGGGESPTPGSEDGGGGSTTTSNEVNPADLGPEEWREYASEQAKAEDEKLKLNMSARPRKWVESVSNANWHGVYEPLNGNVEYVQTAKGKQAKLYQQQQNAGNVQLGAMDSTQLFILVNNGLELMDLSNVPSYKQTPDEVKIAPYFGSMFIKPYVQIYNTEAISDPPKSWKDFLSSRFEDKTLIQDFTPAPAGSAIMLQKIRDGYLEDIRNHYNIKFIKIQPNGSRMVADGRGDVMFVVTFENWIKDKNAGYNTGFIDIAELGFLVPERLSVAKGTPAPWTAKLWIDWVMGPGKRAPVNGEAGTLTIDRAYANPPKLADYNISQGKVWAKEDIEMDLAEAADIFPQRLGYQG